MGNGTPEELGEGAPKRYLTAPPPSEEELRKRFFYHPPRDEQAIINHSSVSAITFDLAVHLCKICPTGRNLSLALTALEDVRMRANAAIACDDPRP